MKNYNGARPAPYIPDLGIAFSNLWDYVGTARRNDSIQPSFFSQNKSTYVISLKISKFAICHVNINTHEWELG